MDGTRLESLKDADFWMKTSRATEKERGIAREELCPIARRKVTYVVTSLPENWLAEFGDKDLRGMELVRLQTYGGVPRSKLSFREIGTMFLEHKDQKYYSSSALNTVGDFIFDNLPSGIERECVLETYGGLLEREITYDRQLMAIQELTGSRKGEEFRQGRTRLSNSEIAEIKEGLSNGGKKLLLQLDDQGQQEAAVHIMGHVTPDLGRPTSFPMIQGPPGAGKTTTVAFSLMVLFEEVYRGHNRVFTRSVVTSTNNEAVEDWANRMDLTQIAVAKLSSEQRIRMQEKEGAHAAFEQANIQIHIGKQKSKSASINDDWPSSNWIFYKRKTLKNIH